ncbi:MAG: two-component regulator propeller domain-containing protein [Alistipes sp.]
MKLRLSVFVLFLCFLADVSANNLRQISSREGISNNAVLSLCQDANGLIWVGTCDGLNLWNGGQMMLFPDDWKKSISLSGNLIEEMTATTDSLFWIRTNYGLDLFDPNTKSVEKHAEFQGMHRFVSRRSDEVLVVAQDNKGYYYDAATRNFVDILLPRELAYADVLEMMIDPADNLWVFSRRGIFCMPVQFAVDGKKFKLGNVTSIPHVATPEYAFTEGTRVYIIDSEQILYEFDAVEKQLVYKKNMAEELAKMGAVSSIIRDGEDYLVSFYTNGVARLKTMPASPAKYVTEYMNVYCGVFSLLKDARQDIVWIGSDGQGLYQYTKDPISFRSITYHNLPYNMSKPTRALFVDKERALWLGTKGEGILRINDFYHCKSFDTQNVRHLTAENSALLNNSVYAFARSARNILWIGGDGHGLNYYSYRDKSVHALSTPIEGLKFIHAVCETDKSTLWVATVGCGVYKVSIGGSDDAPVILRAEQIHFDDELTIKNFFFTLYQESDSVMWFGNRGGGAVRYGMRNGQHEVLKFDRGQQAIANDIFAICRSRDQTMWFGTGGGLIRMGADSVSIAGIRRTIHGILEDRQSNLWLSTNRGLMKYTPQTNNVVTYGYSYGLNTIEYSDGACFADTTGILFFGGINGFVTIEETAFEEVSYYPTVAFRDICINEEIFDVHSLLSDKGVLVLQHGQRIFDITVSALDYINGTNYTYYSRLDGFNDHWIAGSEKLSFADLPSGNYVLNIRYHNNITGEDSAVCSLKIRIKPAWYASILARCIYVLLSLLFVGGVIRYYILKYRRKRADKLQKLNIRRKEEVYDAKMRFFSNITQELSMPLTMISAPCQQILCYAKSEPLILKHAQTIRQNVSKLHDLIYMLHEFRGVHNVEKNDNIELVSVSQICTNISETFAAYAEQNHIHGHFEVEHDLIWPTDKEGLSTILNTLLANAFKHTPYNGEVHLTVKSEAEKLVVEIANNSIGVNLDDIEAIFDRYRVLDYFEKKSEQGLSFQGDLGLAICHSIVVRMQGEITVESTPNTMTTFTVHLPHLKITKESTTPDHTIISIEKAYGLPLPVVQKREYDFDKNRRTMVVVNDNAEIMNFVAELFASDYNIKMLDSAEAAMELLKQMHPDIIICDALSSQSTDAISLIEYVKQGKLTAHIPMILLSTAQQVEERIRGVESGADVCLTLPFNVEYLKAVAEQLLKRNRSLKDYYKSSISAFELSDGKMLHQDDKEFIDKMLRIINDNLSDSNISTHFIADEMGVSIRNLYRRLEGILNQTPTQIIKEYRLAMAEQLLITTKLSIDEIIYKAGFVNRGTFFKCFAVKYGCTPKIYRKQKLSILQDEIGEE